MQNTLTGLHVALDGSGHGIIQNDYNQTVHLHGVGRQGSEYAPYNGSGYFDPSAPTRDEIRVMKNKWNANVVRIALNEDAWLGINGYPLSPDTQQGYQSAILTYISMLADMNFAAIVTLAWNNGGTAGSGAPQAMPDRDHSLVFWRDVAQKLQVYSNVLFDIYDQPYPSSWAVWKSGGFDTSTTFETAGMQELITAIRSVGAQNIIVLNGIAQGRDISGWLVNVPTDPLGQLVAGHHNNNDAGYPLAAMETQVTAIVAGGYPVVATLAVTDCGVGTVVGGEASNVYVQDFATFLDSLDQHYVAWSWGFACGNPGLCDVDGTPNSVYGTNYQTYLKALGAWTAVSFDASSLVPTLPTVVSVGRRLRLV